jgi:sigma-E factor negative regulatory protein RseA
MSDQIREQVSAFLDGELPDSETELLLKRLTRDPDLRESFGRYALIGESMRGSGRTPSVSRGFAARLNRAIDGEPATAVPQPRKAASARWWRPVAGAAVAAGVAAVAIVALQERAVSPGAASAPITAQNITLTTAGLKSAPREEISYTTPAATGGVRVPGTRLTSYVFAHSNFVSGLGQGNVMSGLLSDPDDLPPAAHEVEDASLHPVVNDAVAVQPRDPRIAP